MKKLIKIISWLLLLTFAFPSIWAAAEETPYRSYNQTEWNDAVAAPDAFRPVKQLCGKNFAEQPFLEPTDFYMTEKGELYLLENSGRIIQLDENLQMVNIITQIKTADGQDSPLQEPKGIYVAGENIYIADSGNSRGVRLNKSGVIEQTYEKPSNSAYTAEIFQPTKILADSDGMVYILSEGVYQGAVLFSAEGNFVSFFGSARVQVTFQQIVDRLWKSILSKEAGSNMAQYVPIELSNFDIDNNGFLYTCSTYTNNNVEQIRKLNYLGNNIHPFTGNFGEETTVYYQSAEVSTCFTDIHVDENNVLYALDQTRGRVYAFDSEGQRLFTFGTLGTMTGTFKQPVAVESYNGRVYVLDGQAATITCFEPTEYGEKILEAVALYNDGLYEQALTPWNQVLSMNAGYELAYRGMGEAMMKLGNYKEAVRYFRLGYDRDRESKAFSLYRETILRKNIPLLLIGFFLVIFLLIIITGKKFRHWRKSCHKERKIQKGLYGSFQYLKRLLGHPLETFNEMKFQRYRNIPFVIIVLAALFVTKMLTRQCTGFRFNINNPDGLNIFIELASTVLLFLLYAVASWAICSIADGEGSFLEIVTFNAYAIVPYILFQALAVPLSLVMTKDESVFLTWFTWIGVLWSGFLIFQSMRIVQQYSSNKAIIMILLTLCGVFVILFIVLLLFALFQQVYAFISSIYSELRYRG